MGKAQGQRPGQGQGDPDQDAGLHTGALGQPDQQDRKEGVGAVLLQFLGEVHQHRGNGHQEGPQEGRREGGQAPGGEPEQGHGADPEDQGEGAQHRFAAAEQVGQAPYGQDVKGRGGASQDQGIVRGGGQGCQGHPGLVGPEVPGA